MAEEIKLLAYEYGNESYLYNNGAEPYFQAFAGIGYSGRDYDKGYCLHEYRYMKCAPGNEGYGGTYFECSWQDGYNVYSHDVYADSGYSEGKWFAPGKSLTVTATCGYTAYGGHVYSSTAEITFTVPYPQTITYDTKGGLGEFQEQRAWTGENIIIPSQGPSMAGHKFLGWGTSEISTTPTYAAGDTYNVNASTTLYAVWEANTYEIKYDANGGTGAPESQTKTYGIELALSTVKPTRSNYNFIGWSTSNTATEAEYQSGGSYTSNVSTTLYAVWEVAYTEPVLQNLSLTRCDIEGNPYAIGKYIRVTCDWLLDSSLTLTTCEISGAANKTLFDSDNFYGNVWTVVGGELSQIKDHEIIVTITDSAGQKASISGVLEAESYTAPVISNIVAIRTDSDKNANDDGNCALITFDYSVDPMNDNSNKVSSMLVKYCEHDKGADYIHVTPTYKNGSATAFISKSIDPGKSYDFTIIVTDEVSSTTKHTMVSYAFHTLNFKPGGKGIAIGKRSVDDNTLDVNLFTKFRQPVYMSQLNVDTELTVLGYTYGEEIWTDVTNALNPPKTEQPAPEPTPEDNVELTVKYEI